MEQPPEWLLPRQACSRCAAQTLLSTGELLYDFLGRVAPLEGSGLNYLLNPVRITGLKGWSDFISGWYIVHEEVFVSDDYFEFYAQHTPAGAAFLYVVHQNQASFAAEPGAADLLTCLQHGGDAATFDRLERVRLTTQLIAARLKEWDISGLPTPAEIETLWQVLPPVAPSAAPGAIQEAMKRLVALARRRFAHLEQKSVVGR
jgi:hypothetical protein